MWTLILMNLAFELYNVHRFSNLISEASDSTGYQVLNGAGHIVVKCWEVKIITNT